MKNKIYIFTIILILYLILGNLINKFPSACIIIGTILFTLLTFYVNRRKKASTWFVMVSLVFVNIVVILLYFTFKKGPGSMNYAGNAYILVFVIAILIGHLLAKNWKKHLITLTASFLFNVFAAIYLPIFIEQYTFYDTFTGFANYKVEDGSKTVIDNKDTIQFNKLGKKILVLDYWNNTCGVCYEKFPKFEALKEKYSEDQNVGFYAINSYRKEEEIKKGEELFNSLGLGFETFFQNNSESKKLNIKGFPTVLVIKNDKVIFRGSIEMLSLLDYKYLKI